MYIPGDYGRRPGRDTNSGALMIQREIEQNPPLPKKGEKSFTIGQSLEFLIWKPEIH